VDSRNEGVCVECGLKIADREVRKFDADREVRNFDAIRKG